MKFLLDTCTFLWIISDSPALSQKAKSLFSDRENEIYLSSVSAWEILVKYRLGHLPLPESPHEFIKKQREQHDIQTLPFEEDATLQLLRLPEYHKDPFDRMLICQAINHSLTILTPDKAITQYSVLTMW